MGIAEYVDRPAGDDIQHPRFAPEGRPEQLGAPRRTGTCRRYGGTAPDLIGFQEYQKGNRETYDKKLAGYEYVLGPRYENRKPHAYNAIYWNPKRLELVDSGGFWLSASPEEFSDTWGTHQKRSANWSRFRIIPRWGGVRASQYPPGSQERRVPAAECEAHSSSAECIVRRRPADHRHR